MRTIAHLSDIHFGKIDPPVADALVAYLRAIPHDLLIVSGDFTQRATAGQYRAAMAWLAQFPAPKLYVPGNHDVPLWAFWERFFATFRRYKTFVTPDMEPVWEDEELLVMGVATARAFVPIRNGFWKDGRITARQLRHLLQRKADDKFKVVVTHHPFIPPPGHRPDGVVLGGQQALPLLGDAGVNLLLAGHLHASYHAQLHAPLHASHHAAPYAPAGQTIFSVQAGTATSFRRRHHPDGTEYPNAFNLIRCCRERLEIEVHSYTANRWGLATRAVYKREGKAWEPVSSAG